MKITLNRSDLLKTLRDVIPVTVTRTSMPILSNVLFEIDSGILTLHASNLEASISSMMECDVQDKLTFLIEAKFLQTWLSNQNQETISITLNPASVILQAGTSKTKVNTLDPNDFVRIENITDNEFILTDELQTALSATVLATVSNPAESRPYLRGVNIAKHDDSLDFAGMNGIYMIAYKIDGSNVPDIDLMVPNRSISILTKLMAGSENIVVTYIPEKAIQFSMHGGNKIFRTQLLVCRYPDYKRLLPTSADMVAVVNRSDLIRSMNTAMLFGSDNNDRVSFEFSQTNLLLSAISSLRGEYEDNLEAVAMFGTPVSKFTLNGTYILSWLRSQSCDNIQIERNESYNALAVFRSADDEMTDKSYLLIPPMIEVK